MTTRTSIAQERRDRVARLIAEAGPQGLAIRHLVEIVNVTRDQINDDIDALRTAGRVVNIRLGGPWLSVWVTPEHQDEAMRIAAQRAEQAHQASQAAKARRKREKRLEARLMREAESYGRKLTPEERQKLRRARLIEASKMAREAAIEQIMQPKHLIVTEWPAVSAPPGPRSVFELA